MPKCCVCKLPVFRIKAPGVQCSGACREFYHFEKCSHLTNNEMELIERQRLTWQCKGCKSKRSSLIFSRSGSVSDTDTEADKFQYEKKILSNQNAMMASLADLKSLVESCVTRVNYNSSKIDLLLNRNVNDDAMVTSNTRTVLDNLDERTHEIMNEIEAIGDTSSESDIEEAVTVVTTAQVHRNYSEDTIVMPNSNSNKAASTQQRKKKPKRKPINRGKISRLIVRPTHSQTSDKTKDDLRNKVNVSVPISGVRNAANGGVIIACKNSDEIQALQKEAADHLGIDYEVRLLEKYNPKILIVGMSTLIDKTSLSQKLKSQNSFLQNSTITVVKVQQSTKSKYFNAVVELDNQSYKKALQLKKVFIDWERCFVYENVYVVQCYKCCGYNHKTDICKNVQSCSKCAQQHLFKDCSNDFTRCINCKTANEKFKMNLDVNHPSWDKKCTVYLRKIQLERRKINYND